MEHGELKVANILLVVSAGVLAYGTWRLAVAVEPATLPWMITLLIASFITACLFSAVFMNFAAKPNVALAAIMLVLSFAAGNFVLQVAGRSLVDIVDAKLFTRMSRPAVAAASGGDFAALDPSLPFDDRTVQQVQQDLKDAGFPLNAFYNPGALYQAIDLNLIQLPLFPLSGPSNKFPGTNNVAVSCVEGRQHDWPIFRKDRYGFNNDDIVFSHKNLYQLIGGSFAQGSCVHQDETLQSLLTRRGYPTFATAIGGLGALTALGSLKEYGEPLKPKVVLWQFYDPNDIALLSQKELRSPGLLDYLRDGFTQDLIHRQDEVDAIWARANEWQDRVTAINKNDEYGKAWEQMLDSNLSRVRELLGNDIATLREDDDLLTIYERIMSLANKRIAAWGGRLYIVLFPNEDVYSVGSVPKFRRRVIDYMSKNGIGTIDVDPALRQSGDPLQFFAERKGWSHFNAAGYALMARQIVARLKQDTAPSGPDSQPALALAPAPASELDSAQYTQVSELTAVLRADKAQAQPSDGALYAAIKFTPSSATAMLKIHVVANFYSDQDSEAVLAVFRKDEPTALYLKSIAVPAGKRTTIEDDFTTPAKVAGPVDFEFRVGPAKPEPVLFNGPRDANPVPVSSATIGESG